MCVRGNVALSEGSYSTGIIYLHDMECFSLSFNKLSLIHTYYLPLDLRNNNIYNNRIEKFYFLKVVCGITKSNGFCFLVGVSPSYSKRRLLITSLYTSFNLRRGRGCFCRLCLV